jgi:citrate lyase gamma subunit
MKSEAKRVLREAKAGLNDKGDLVVHLKPAGDQSGVQLDIESKGMSLFGEQIRASVLETIESYKLYDLYVSVRDQGERIPLKTIEELRDIAYGITGIPQKPKFTDKIVALIEYRDVTLIDVLREIER